MEPTKKHSKVTALMIAAFLAFSQQGVGQNLGFNEVGVQHIGDANIVALQQSHAAQPDNVEVSAELALAYIQRSQQTGEIEQLSYARLVLQPWLAMPSPPQSVLLPRAYLAIDAHDKSAALSDLDRLQKAKPSDPQILLSRALIYQDLEQYAKAIGLCYEVSAKASGEIASACLASVFMAMGQVDRAKPLLQSIESSEQPLSQSTDIWLLRLQTRYAIAKKETFAEEYYRSQLQALGAVYEEAESPYLVD